MRCKTDSLRHGSRSEALERDKTEKIIREFHLQNSDKDYIAFTVTTCESHLRNLQIWEQEEARNDLATSVLNRTIHRLSSVIEKNYKRDTFSSVRFKAIGSIEHRGRANTHLVAPHVHGTLAVHPSWTRRFLSLLEPDRSGGGFSLSRDFWNSSMRSLRQEVSSIYMKPVSNLFRWSAYCFKQVPHPELDINTDDQWSALVFTHDGLAKPKTNL